MDVVIDSTVIAVNGKEARTGAAVYAIYNTKTGFNYVGATRNFISRLQNCHLVKLRAGKHSNEYLQRAFNEDGEEAFEYQMLEVCEPAMLDEREIWWIEHLGSADRSKGYNITSGGRCAVPPDETRKKMSKAKKGKQPLLGRRLSDSTKEKIRQAHLGTTVPEAARRQMSASCKRFWADIPGDERRERTERRIAAVKAAMTPEKKAKQRAAIKAYWAKKRVEKAAEAA